VLGAVDNSLKRRVRRCTAAIVSITLLACKQPRSVPVNEAGPAAAQKPPSSAAPSAASAAPAAPRQLNPSAPVTIEFGGRHTAQYFAPAVRREAAPLVVMLHGMCALPEYECPAFRAGTAAHGGLFCPPGPVACPGGGAMWTGSDAGLLRAIRTGLGALAAHAGQAPATSKLLIGYSLGASAAARIVTADKGQWTALMLVNAAPALGAKPLIDAGIERVALVAGARDRTAPKLRRSAAALARAGLDARYFELADTGHYFDATTEQRMTVPLTWLLQPR
jgi:predicted esterase